MVVVYHNLWSISIEYGGNDDDDDVSVSDDDIRARWVLIILVMKVAQSTRAAFCQCRSVQSVLGGDGGDASNGRPRAQLVTSSLSSTSTTS